MTNEEIRTHAQTALSTWIFDQETDPHGTVKAGLEHLASEGDWDQDVIDARITVSADDWKFWDQLQDWAKDLGEGILYA